MDEPVGTGPAVRIERLIPAAPEDVYAAWTDEALLRRWMSPFGHAEVVVDPRVGGALQVAMVDAGVRIEHTGEFLELDPPRRLRFTWISPYTGGEPSIVTVSLTPVGTHTRLVLIHERLPADAVESHAGGWGTMVDRLAEVLASGASSEVMP
jgi:uncharacterized protein YndB with AHSA1/START domain